MFGIPGKAAVTITPAASRQITRLMQREGSQGLRIGVKKGGCAGMEYTMEYAESRGPIDEVVEDQGVTLLVEPKAVLFLLGTEMDYVTEKLSARFVFNNPNQTDACGCGDSVTIVPAAGADA